MVAAVPSLAVATALNTPASAPPPPYLQNAFILRVPLKNSARKNDSFLRLGCVRYEHARRKAKLARYRVDRRGGAKVFAKGGEAGGHL